MTTTSEWRNAVEAAVANHPKDRKAIIQELTSRFPTASRPTIEERLSRHAEWTDTLGYRLRGSPRPRTPTSLAAPTDGPSWIASFRAIGLAKPFADRFRTVDKNSDWTKLLLDLFAEMAKNAGFTVPGPSQINRWDQTWLDSNGAVVAIIEHENDGWPPATLDSELNHLILGEGPLRVLVTYFPEAKFREGVRQTRELVVERLSKRAKWDCEFLLVAAPYGLDDIRDYHFWSIRPTWLAERI